MKVLTTKRIASFISTSILVSIITLTGCSENSPIEPESNFAYDENADVAESVAGTVGEDTGGMMDQMNDMMVLAGDESLAKTEGDFFESKEKNWDEATQSWIISVKRERGYEESSFYALIEREYQVQFLNSGNVPQKFWITNNDTATTMTFKIVTGEGRHKTLKLSQELLELDGSFTATGVNTDTVTFVGNYSRAAVDTITTERFTRIHNHSTALSFTLAGPRMSSADLTQHYTGQITGTYNADIEFNGENGMVDRSIEKSFTIDVDEANAEIIINKHLYMCSLITGQVE